VVFVRAGVLDGPPLALSDCCRIYILYKEEAEAFPLTQDFDPLHHLACSMR
jgi:hypothetical protein